MIPVGAGIQGSVHGIIGGRAAWSVSGSNLGEGETVILKIMGVVAWLLLPLSAMLWYRSHVYPFQHRYDATLYKSLRVYLRDGVCSFRLLSMPTKTASKSEFNSPLTYNATPQERSFLLTSHKNGPYRVTWLAFPLWLSTMTLALIGVAPVIRGPVRQLWRQWKGWCRDCGYDLTGNRSGRCPECGVRLR